MLFLICTGGFAFPPFVVNIWCMDWGDSAHWLSVACSGQKMAEREQIGGALNKQNEENGHLLLLLRQSFLTVGGVFEQCKGRYLYLTPCESENV